MVCDGHYDDGETWMGWHGGVISVALGRWCRRLVR
jgi:hypothetical protein